MPHQGSLCFGFSFLCLTPTTPLCLEEKNTKLKHAFKTLNESNKIPGKMSSKRKTLLFPISASVPCLAPRFRAGGHLSKQPPCVVSGPGGLWPPCLQTCPWTAVRMACCVRLLLLLLGLHGADPAGGCRPSNCVLQDSVRLVRGLFLGQRSSWVASRSSLSSHE